MAGEEISLTIEQTNALRLKLGLKPLRVTASDKAAEAGNKDGSTGPLTSEQQDRQAVENLRKRRAEADAVRRDEDAQARLNKARLRLERDRKLQGRTLGLADDDDGGDESTRSWVKRLKRTPVIIRPQPDATNTATQTYDSRQLDGLKVGHDLEDIEAGSNVILTLDDANVLDENGDELVNVDLAAQDKLRRAIASRQKVSALDGFDKSGSGQLLSKYDDALGASGKPEGFRISSAIGQSRSRPRPSFDVDDEDRVGESILDETGGSFKLQSDYREDKPIKIKKRVRKEKTSGKVKVLEELGDIDTAKVKNISAELLEPRGIHVADQKTIRTRDAQDLAAEVRRKRQLEQESMQMDDREGGLVIDEASAFAGSLQRIEAPAGRDAASRDVEMPDMPAAVTNPLPGPAAEESSLATVTAPNTQVSAVFEEEKLVDQGLGSTMALLREKGVVGASNDDDATARQEREAWLAKDRRIRLELDLERSRLREKLRTDPKIKAMSNRQREKWQARENRRIDEMEAAAAREVPRLQATRRAQLPRRVWQEARHQRGLETHVAAVPRQVQRRRQDRQEACQGREGARGRARADLQVSWWCLGVHTRSRYTSWTFPWRLLRTLFHTVSQL